MSFFVHFDAELFRRLHQQKNVARKNEPIVGLLSYDQRLSQTVMHLTVKKKMLLSKKYFNIVASMFNLASKAKNTLYVNKFCFRVIL